MCVTGEVTLFTSLVPFTEVSRTYLPTSRHKRHAAWHRHPKQKQDCPYNHSVHNAVKDRKVRKYIFYSM